MKSFIIFFTLLLTGCSASGAPNPAKQESPQVRAGLLLAEKSQCHSCHVLDRKVIGPSWKDISARYNREIASGKISEEQVIAALEKKIAMGGKGNWIPETGGMSMPPSYPKVSKENIGKLAIFILSLGKGSN